MKNGKIEVRRAASSVTANIIDINSFDELSTQANHTHQLLQGFIRKTKSFINH